MNTLNVGMTAVLLVSATVIEALNGFLLITWSASFTYLMTHRYWHPERA